MQFDSTVVCTPQSLTLRYDAHYGAFEKFEFLSKIETEFEDTLACLSVALMGSNHEKNRGRKSRDTLPLNGQKEHYFGYLSKIRQYDISSTNTNMKTRQVRPSIS